MVRNVLLVLALLAVLLAAAITLAGRRSADHQSAAVIAPDPVMPAAHPAPRGRQVDATPSCAKCQQRLATVWKHGEERYAECPAHHVNYWSGTRWEYLDQWKAADADKSGPREDVRPFDYWRD